MTISRRALLATVGTGLVAGCLTATGDDQVKPGDVAGTDGSTDSDTTTTPSNTAQVRRVSMGETASIGHARVTVANPRVGKAVVSRGVHTRVVADAGQYVVVDVTTDSGQLRSQDLPLGPALDGHLRDDATPVATTAGPNSYAFLFPTERTETATIQSRNDDSSVAWRLPAATRELLELEPLFTVESFAVSGDDGDRMLELTVSNDGERDGQFVARLSLDRFSGGQILEFTVPTGESREYAGRPGDILLLQSNHGGQFTLQYPTDDGLSQLTHGSSGS